jgi:carbamoyl-phosphate synthase small subunit
MMNLMTDLHHHKPALLALADGNLFYGTSIGASGKTVGEVVFNTSMTGYQEILTDPSYAQQIITFTYPHIGNVGVNPEDMESNKVWAAGLIIRELSPIVSNWRAQQSLDEFLKQNNIIGIADIDTRRLTQILRDKGVQNGCIVTGECDANEAIDTAKKFPPLAGQDLAKTVSTKQIIEWKPPSQFKYHVVVYDFGVKHNILHMLTDRGCRLTIVPAQYSASKVLKLKPDGVLLSNGPGDPAACSYAIENIKILLENNIPLFGICLGFQMLALACGAKTIKVKFGHHGANHPVKDLKTGMVTITSQNHNFVVDEKSLPQDLQITHRSLFDNTLQGIQHKTKPAFAFQGHPEASPGPHDIAYLFDRFIDLIHKPSGETISHAKTN